MGTALAGSAWAGTWHAVSMEMPGGKGRGTVCLHCAVHEGWCLSHLNGKGGEVWTGRGARGGDADAGLEDTRRHGLRY